MLLEEGGQGLGAGAWGKGKVGRWIRLVRLLWGHRGGEGGGEGKVGTGVFTLEKEGAKGEVLCVCTTPNTASGWIIMR